MKEEEEELGREEPMNRGGGDRWSKRIWCLVLAWHLDNLLGGESRKIMKFIP